VVAIWNHSFVFSGTSARSEPYTSHDYQHLIGVARVLVAERSGVIEGTLALLAPQMARVSIARQDELEITRLAVGERSRGRGIARLLLTCAHRDAARGGAGALVLWTEPHQIEAQHLYRSLGYRRRPERDRAADGRDRLVYVLTLRQDGRTTGASRSRV
jgi:ribosomal protein S18 acetylase RimI-like enzyme